MCNKLILVLFATLVLNSCTKELPFPDIKSDLQLVVNSYLIAENKAEIHVSESCHVTDANCEAKFISNAIVQIRKSTDSQYTVLDHQSDGIYTAEDYIIDSNTEYHVEVEHQSRKVTAQCQIPKQFTATYIGSEETVSEWGIVWAFEVEIEDDPAQENFYLIEGYIEVLGASRSQSFEEEVNGYVEPRSSHYTKDPNTENSAIAAGIDYIEYPLRRIYLPDNNFNGKTYNTKFYIKDNELHRERFENYKAHIIVKSVSKELYDYEKSLAKNRLNNGDLFAEPELIYTNVESGLGIFVGYTVLKFEDDLPASQYSLPRNIDIENGNCIAPCTVKFSSDGGPLLNYSWDFGDGNTSTEPNPEHAYTASGEYEAVLLISEGSGDISSYILTVTIR